MVAGDSTDSLVNGAATIVHMSLGPQALPIELLCHTLLFLPMKELIVATHVCLSWREAALAEPSLWTDISLNGSTDPNIRTMWQLGEPWPYPSFLEDLLVRSRSLPVQLNIRRLDKPYFAVFCQVVRRHMYHIRALRIMSSVPCFISPDDCPDFALPTLVDPLRRESIFGGSLLMITLCTPGPLLEELCVQQSAGLLPSDFFAHFPKLHTLTLAGWGVSLHVASPATNVVRVKIEGTKNSWQPPTLKLFQHFPNMRELEMTGVGRQLLLPLMGPTNTLQRLTIVPAGSDWQFKNTQPIVPERITHIVITFPSPIVSREFLTSLGSIHSVELNYSDTNDNGLQLLARTAGDAMSRELNALCTRVLAEIFDGWQTTCLDGVTSAVISDRLPWSNVLAALSAMRSLKTLTFLVSARTTKGVFRNRNWDELGGPLLFADGEAFAANLAAACPPRLPALRVLHFRAVDPVQLNTQGVTAEPDELSLGGMAAHRVSAALVRQWVSCFHQRLDHLIFDRVMVREGFGLQDAVSLGSMVSDFVVKLP